MPRQLAPPIHIRRLSENVQKSLVSSLTITCMNDAVLELIYNSLDAESSHIQIEIDFSQYKIVIKDNGQGINQDDFLLLGKLACTSKCIDSPFTRGYRGQALVSLTNLGFIEITSKAVGQNFRFTRLLNQEPSYSSAVEDPYPSGTTVVCSNLFSNMPVRKSQWQVQNQLDKLKKSIEKLAVVHSNVRFQLYDVHRQSELLHIYPTRSLRQSFLQVYSKKSSKIPITSNFQYLVSSNPSIWMTGIRINNLVSRIEWVFLNGRYANCASLKKRVFEYLEKETASEGFISHISCAHLLEPNIENFFGTSKKDLNSSSPMVVVPSKLKKKRILPTTLQEVLPRVRSGSDLQEPFAKLQNITREIQRPYIIDPRTGNSRYVDPPRVLPRLSKSRPVNFLEESFVYPTPPAPIPQPIFEQSLSLQKTMLPHMKVLGQLVSKFILAIHDRYIFLFDQHAADERVLLESLLASPWNEPTLVSVEILIPSHLYYNGFGFTMTPQSSMSTAGCYIKTVPKVIANLPPQKWIQVLEQLVETEHALDSTSPPKPLMELLCSKACRSAIMFGDPLSLQACQALVNALSQCQFPFQCAHGRPSVIPILALPPSTVPSKKIKVPRLYQWLTSMETHPTVS